jgi:hypothetical protein
MNVLLTAAHTVHISVPSPRLRGEGNADLSARPNWVRGTLDRSQAWRIPLTLSIPLRDRAALSPHSPSKTGVDALLLGRGHINAHPIS